MTQLHAERKRTVTGYVSYIVGFVLSVVTTLAAYLLVVNQVGSKEVLIYAILGIAVVQLVVQMIFFLHLGRGSKWKAITFYFTLMVVFVIVVGTIWIMNNLDYNMMHMNPEEVKEYMHENQGI